MAKRLKECTEHGSYFGAEKVRPRPLIARPPPSQHETLTSRPGIGCASMNAHHSLTNPKWRAQLLNSSVRRPSTSALATPSHARVSSLTPYGSFSLLSPTDHEHLDRLAISSRIGTGSPWSFATGRVHPTGGSHDGWPQPLGGGFRHTHREFTRQWSLRAPDLQPDILVRGGRSITN